MPDSLGVERVFNQDEDSEGLRWIRVVKTSDTGSVIRDKYSRTETFTWQPGGGSLST